MALQDKKIGSAPTRFSGRARVFISEARSSMPDTIYPRLPLPTCSYGPFETFVVHSSAVPRARSDAAFQWPFRKETDRSLARGGSNNDPYESRHARLRCMKRPKRNDTIQREPITPRRRGGRGEYSR